MGGGADTGGDRWTWAERGRHSGGADTGAEGRTWWAGGACRGVCRGCERRPGLPGLAWRWPGLFCACGGSNGFAPACVPFSSEPKSGNRRHSPRCRSGCAWSVSGLPARWVCSPCVFSIPGPPGWLVQRRNLRVQDRGQRAGGQGRGPADPRPHRGGRWARPVVARLMPPCLLSGVGAWRWACGRHCVRLCGTGCVGCAEQVLCVSLTEEPISGVVFARGRARVLCHAEHCATALGAHGTVMSVPREQLYLR